jgi:hypothetical protein
MNNGLERIWKKQSQGGSEENHKCLVSMPVSMLRSELWSSQIQSMSTSYSAAAFCHCVYQVRISHSSNFSD